MHRGYVKTYRRLFSSDLWLAEPFTRGQAWLDLIGIANHKPGFFRVRGVKVDVPRGTVGWSQLRLAERWQWSRGKVQRFLDELERGQQIVQQKTRISTLIRLVNYELYQGDGTTEQTTDRTTDGQQTDTNKNEKKVKNEKKNPPTHHSLTRNNGTSLLKVFPERFRMSLCFSEAWRDWEADRKERRKPITERAAKGQMQKLTVVSTCEAAKMIQQSIDNSYLGIFPLKKSGGFSAQEEIWGRPERLNRG